MRLCDSKVITPTRTLPRDRWEWRGFRGAKSASTRRRWPLSSREHHHHRMLDTEALHRRENDRAGANRQERALGPQPLAFLSEPSFQPYFSALQHQTFSSGTRSDRVPAWARLSFACSALILFQDAAGGCWETDLHSAARARPPGGRDWLLRPRHPLPGLTAALGPRSTGSGRQPLRRGELTLAAPSLRCGITVYTYKYKYPEVCISS